VERGPVAVVGAGQAGLAVSRKFGLLASSSDRLA